MFNHVQLVSQFQGFPSSEKMRIGLIHNGSIDYTCKSLVTLQTKHEVTVILGWQDSIYTIYMYMYMHHKVKPRTLHN